VLKRFKVTVIRTAYREMEIEVEAAGPKQAEEKALEIAPNREFPTEHDADYEVAGHVETGHVETI